MALYSMTFLGIAPFGALLAGVAADRFGAPFTVGAGGLVCLAGATVFWSRWPALRAAARELVAAQLAADAPPEETTRATGSEATPTTRIESGA